MRPFGWRNFLGACSFSWLHENRLDLPRFLSFCCRLFCPVKWISSRFISKQMTSAEQICRNKSRQTLIQCLNKQNSIFFVHGIPYCITNESFVDKTDRRFYSYDNQRLLIIKWIFCICFLNFLSLSLLLFFYLRWRAPSIDYSFALTFANSITFRTVNVLCIAFY